jgi:hypothetical protein
MTTTSATLTSPTLTLTSWEIPTRGQRVHDARSSYVERCWLPILGPSTLLFLRFAVACLDDSPDGVTLQRNAVASALGLGGRDGGCAPFERMLGRAADFRIVRSPRAGVIEVRRHLLELSPRQLLRAPEIVRQAHDALRESDATSNTGAQQADRLARALALMGESPKEIEEHLRRWRFPPSTARLSARRAAHCAPPESRGPSRAEPVASSAWQLTSPMPRSKSRS